MKKRTPLQQGVRRKKKDEEKQSVISGVDSITQDQQQANSYGVSNPVSVGNTEHDMRKQQKQPSIHRVCAGSSFVRLKVGNR